MVFTLIEKVFREIRLDHNASFGESRTLNNEIS